MIRPAQVQDAPRIAGVFLAARKRHVPFAPLAHSDLEVREWIRDVLVPSGGVYVYIQQEAIVGYIAISKHDGVGWIEHLYVDPAHLGRGHGSMLLSFAKKMIEPPIRLYTFQANDGARRFYQRAGFCEVQYSDGSLNEERCPDVLLEWRPQSAEPGAAMKPGESSGKRKCM